MTTTPAINLEAGGAPVAAPFIAGAALLEGAHLAEMMGLQLFALSVQAMEEGLQTQHNLLMAMLGYRPEQHKAPWDTLAEQDGWLKAFDLALAAAGE